MPFLSDHAAVRNGLSSEWRPSFLDCEMRLQNWTKKHTFRSLTFKTEQWTGKRYSSHFVPKYLPLGILVILCQNTYY